MSRAFAPTGLPAPVLLDTLLVKLRDWAELDQVVAEVGGSVVVRMAPIRWAAVRIDHVIAADAFRAYEARSEVEDVWFDEVAESTAAYLQAYNDSILPYQWNLHRMNVLAAWGHARGAGILASVIDQGFDVAPRSRPEFSSKTFHHWNGYYNSDQGPDPYDEFAFFDATIDSLSVNAFSPTAQHGLSTAGLLAAGATGDGTGMVGVAPDADLVNMAAWAKLGAQPSIPVSGMLNSMLLSVDRYAAKVISMSIIGGTAAAWLDTLNYGCARAMVFSGACNDGQSPEDDGYSRAPAVSLDACGGFCVGCIDSADRPTYYSGYGAMVNVAAPGHQVWTPHWSSTSAPNMLCAADWQSVFGAATRKVAGTVYADYVQFLGTSAATPLAAGVAALIWSVNPALPLATVKQIYRESMDRPDNWLFNKRFPNPAAGVPNALKGVLKALAVSNPGTVRPYVGFLGPGVRTTVAAGVATLHLRGPLRVELDAFSTDTITDLRLYAGATLIYQGTPLRSMEGTALKLSADALTGGTIRVVATSPSVTADVAYDDIVVHAGLGGAVAPPLTSHVQVGDTITLSAVSDAHPVRISYRWGTGPWQRYAGPMQVEASVLEYFGVDVLGNVEGGVDHDPDP